MDEELSAIQQVLAGPLLCALGLVCLRGKGRVATFILRGTMREQSEKFGLPEWLANLPWAAFAVAGAATFVRGVFRLLA